MDIAILAGGYGTRLKGIWDKPKCLIPYRGQPLIEFLVNQALELRPRKIFLLLGHKASEVVAWHESCCLHRDVVSIIETKPEGTASAIRNALPLIQPCFLMVLNGDTIPGYDLNKIIGAFNSGAGKTTVAWADGCYAGTSVFGARGINQIIYSKETDLNVFVNDLSAARVNTLGFLDVGTTEGFRKSQQFWPKNYDRMECT